MFFSHIITKKIFKTLSAVGVALFLFSCGGGGGPGAPSTPSVAPVEVTEAPLDTTISGTAQGIGAAEASPATVTLLAADGAEVVKVPLKEDGTFEMPTVLTKSESGFYKITVRREGLPDLETAAHITAGEKDKSVTITLATTLAVIYAEAFNVDGLERAESFYIDLMMSLDQNLVERAFNELISIRKGEISLENANATREILSEILNRL